MRVFLPLLALSLAGAAPAPVPTPATIDLDPATLLPPPPARGSAQALAELAELHAQDRSATTEQRAAATKEGETKNPSIFVEVLGPRFDLDKLPATRALLQQVRAAEKAIVDRGKDEFRRPRPWIVDPTLHACSQSEKPLSSYPSGHTSMAFSMAGTLARLVPAKAPALMARAARYGESRIVCEQHFRSDVTAGEALGLLIADRLAASPSFATSLDSARRELVRAGLAPA